jgi:hypothetical protein
MQRITIAIIAVLLVAAVSPATGAPLRTRDALRNQAMVPPATFDQCRTLSAQRGDRLWSSRKAYVSFMDQCMNGTIR